MAPESLASTRSQSAMEYLMTYGWAILAIAIVFGVLYYLGIFGGAVSAPLAQPGSCQVFRPNGPGTSYDAGLSGACNDEMPEYVAKFNGQSSYISTPLMFPTASTTNALTVSVWIYTYGSCSVNNFYCGIVDSDNGVNGWGLMAGLQTADYWTHGGNDMKFGFPPGSWTNIVLVYQGVPSTASGYVNGNDVDPNNALPSITLPDAFGIQIGMARQSTTMDFNGLIANVQIYNTSLSANEVSALYTEGIGGAPIKLQNLLGWWPLNGNPNDYSGNQNNGAPTNVVYISTTGTGYTPP